MIKLGIIGSNFVSDWMCESVDVSEGIVNYAVYSRTAEKGTEFAQKHRIPNIFTDMEEFLSSAIDAVPPPIRTMGERHESRQACSGGKARRAERSTVGRNV